MYHRPYLCFVAFQLSLVCSLASSFAALDTMTTRRRKPQPLPSSQQVVVLLRGGSSSNDSSTSGSNSGRNGPDNNPTSSQPPPSPPVELSITVRRSSNNGKDSRLGRNSSPPGPLRRAFPAFPWHKLPDWFTYARCLAIPALVVSFYAQANHVPTALLFAAASFTDWVDGYLARRWDITSAFGAFLDPVVRVRRSFVGVFVCG